MKPSTETKPREVAVESDASGQRVCRLMGSEPLGHGHGGRQVPLGVLGFLEGAEWLGDGSRLQICIERLTDCLWIIHLQVIQCDLFIP